MRIKYARSHFALFVCMFYLYVRAYEYMYQCINKQCMNERPYSNIMGHERASIVQSRDRIL